MDSRDQRIEQVAVKKWLQYCVKLGRAQRRRLELQPGSIAQSAGIDPGVFLDEPGALLIVTAELLEADDLPA